ncbi:MAG: hypothetical protein M1817_002213 [Caeruleum heppii]|nr:MAG: hypothetical protein M1817_002213 [Caeruleum heppii]
MKFFSTLFFLSFFALAYCAAVSKPESEYEVAKREVSQAKYVPSVLPNGKKSIAVYDGDVLEGSLVEGDDGDVLAFDAFGQAIDLDDLSDDADGEKAKRQSRFTILRRFFGFIKKYGQRAWNFLYCISFEVALKCADDILQCATQGVPPWACLEGLVCGVSIGHSWLIVDEFLEILDGRDWVPLSLGKLHLPYPFICCCSVEQPFATSPKRPIKTCGSSIALKMVVMNVFRYLGDVSHTSSKAILIWSIHSNRSAEGVSLITQALYFLVFVARYVNIFWVPPERSWWTFVLKILYVTSSLYIVVLMLRVFPRSREREKSWKLGAASLGAAVVLGPVLTAICERKKTNFPDVRLPFRAIVLWTFSITLESTCILPQLLLLRQTAIPTVIDSFYLVTLGSYRFLYILNWIVRVYDPFDPIHRDATHPVAVIFGIMQTALYLDFAYVYWFRQRVKLRGGGVVDAEDLSRGFLVGRMLERVPGHEADEDDGDGDVARGENGFGRWGNRGISVSADEGLAHGTNGRPKGFGQGYGDSEPVLGDGDEDDDDEDDGHRPGDGLLASGRSVQGVTGGQEWRENGR